MSIILKGIDMPKDANIVIGVANDENFKMYFSSTNAFQVIQIPKGARLIDANEISKDLEEWKQRPNNDDDAVVLVNHFQGIIRTASTILESEEE